MLTMLKTEAQISKKIDSFKKKLIKKKKIYENFGDREKNKLDNFIGDYYAYDQSIRLSIYILVEDFSDWCENYTFPGV